MLLPVRDAEATLGTALRSVARQTERALRVRRRRRRLARRERSRSRARAAARDPRFRVLARRGRASSPRSTRGLAALPRAARRAHGRRRLDAPRAARARSSRRSRRSPTLGGRRLPRALLPARARSARGCAPTSAGSRSIDSPGRVRREAFVECPLAHPTCSCARDALRRLRLPRRGLARGLRPRAAAARGRARRVGVVPRRLLGWRDHAATPVAHATPRYAIERFTACKAAYLARGFLAGGAPYVLWGYGGDRPRAARARSTRTASSPPRSSSCTRAGSGSAIHGAPVIPRRGARPRRRALPLVVSVAGAVARALIRARARAPRLARVRRLRLRGVRETDPELAPGAVTTAEAT